MNSPAWCLPWRTRLWARWWATAAIFAVVFGAAARAQPLPRCDNNCLDICLLRCDDPLDRRCRSECYRRCCTLPPAGTFVLRITPQALDVSWGQPATYSVQITGQNNFSRNVSLSAANVPSGATPAFAPNPVLVTAANATQTSILTLATTQAATRPGRSAFSVGASAAGVPAQTVNASVHVLRTAGPFTTVTPNKTSSFSCTRASAVGPPVILPVTVSAIVGPALNGPGVQFETPSGNWPTLIPFSQGYTISPTCRVGIVVPPVSSSGQIFLDFYNLDFDPSTGTTHPIPSNSVVIQVAFQAVYFSPDDSLVVIIGPTPPGSPQAQIATLWDMVTGASIGPSQFFTANNLVITLAGNRATLSGTGPQGQPISFSWTVP